MAEPIPMSHPDLSEREIDLVSRVLRSGRLALGPMVERFEAQVATQAGVSNGVAVSSGTAGLFVALKALDIGPGDEVVTTPLSFIASATPILMVGATPVFVDVCPKTLNMDPKKVEAAITPRTKAIMAVEAFGNPAYMDEYARIAAHHEIPMIEDSCEALGASHKGRACGGFGRVGVFGFYPNKQITTGEGGMIVTHDDRLADLCRSLRNQGRAVSGPTTGGTPLGSWLTHERLGYNFRMSEVNAAIGVAQMERLDDILERRRQVASWYTEALAGHPDLVLPTVLPESKMSWFVYVVRLTAGYTREERDRVIQGLRTHDIGAADYFPCIHLQPGLASLGLGPGSYPTAESIAERTIALPFHGNLRRSEVEIVAQTLDLMLSRESITRG